MAKHSQTNSASQGKESSVQRRTAKPDGSGPVAANMSSENFFMLQRAIENPGAASPQAILALQGVVGNRSVSRLIQTKLVVGPVGDKYEQEADHIAEQVAKMPPAQQTGIPEKKESPAKPGDQRDDAEPQLKPPIQREAGSGSALLDASLEQDIEQSRGQGHKLPENVRTDMEYAFDTDFGGVRIHTDSDAAHLSRTIDARAFTLDQDIYFNTGTYDPASAAGRELLAHELTHVVQQTGKPQADRAIKQPGDRDEEEAVQVGQMIGQYERVNGMQAAPIQAQIQAAEDVDRVVQRNSGGVTAAKVGKAVLKGFGMSFVNALAGPISFAWTFGDKRKEWKVIAQKKPYGEGALAKTAEVLAGIAIVLREIGAIAGWVSLLTGIAALIAAAIPAGQAVAAVLGSISAIAGTVGAIAASVQGGLNLILAIGNLIRLPRVKGTKQRALAKATITKDFIGALAGALGAVAGAVGGSFKMDSLVTSTSAMTADIAEKGVGGLAKEWAVSTWGVGHSFAVGSEIGGEVGGTIAEPYEKKHAKLEELPQQAHVGGQQMVDVSPHQLKKQLKNIRKSPLPGTEAQPDIYRAPDEAKDGSEGGATPEALAKLSEVSHIANEAKGWATEDLSIIGGEKAEVAEGMGVASRVEETLNRDVKQVSNLRDGLDEMEEKGQEGESQAEAMPKKVPENEMAEDKAAKIETANEELDKVEAKSGEKFGKRGFFAKIGTVIKKGWRSFRKWFLSSVLSLKKRLKNVFAKIKQKIARFIIKVTGLDEPLSELEGAAVEAKTAAPVATHKLDEAEAGTTNALGVAQQLGEASQQAKEMAEG